MQDRRNKGPRGKDRTGTAADHGQGPPPEVAGGGKAGAGVEPVRQPIDGVLDLHTFRPSELGALLPEYIGECQGRGFSQVRVIHGKGTGTLRTTVHSLLQRDPRVLSYALADAAGGGWGATVAQLRPSGPDR